MLSYSVFNTSVVTQLGSNGESSSMVIRVSGTSSSITSLITTDTFFVHFFLLPTLTVDVLLWTNIIQKLNRIYRSLLHFHTHTPSHNICIKIFNDHTVVQVEHNAGSSMCAQTISVERNDLWPRYMGLWHAGSSLHHLGQWFPTVLWHMYPFTIYQNVIPHCRDCPTQKMHCK